MFIHFGVYSQHARHEWAMEDEAIPIEEYTLLAQQFKSGTGFCAWPVLREASPGGQRYMVLTTKRPL